MRGEQCEAGTCSKRRIEDIYFKVSVSYCWPKLIVGLWHGVAMWWAGKEIKHVWLIKIVQVLQLM